MSGGEIMCCDAFLRANFDFGESHGRCAVVAKRSELFLVAEVFEGILYRYSVCGMS